MGNNTKMMMEFKEDMMKTFEMTDLGLMSYFLGIEVSQINEGLFISQKKYTEGLLKKFKMYGCKCDILEISTRNFCKRCILYDYIYI